MRINKTKILLISLMLLIGLNGYTQQQQNVLFIIVDDLKPLINSYGATQINTPNLDALAAQSTVFSNAHCQQAVCAPSRVSFMTGMRPDFTQVWDLKTKMRNKVPNSLTMPEYFKNNGYQTVGLGKVLHGAKKNDPQSWTIPFIEDLDLDYAEGFPIPANFKYQGKEEQKLYNQLKTEITGDPTSDKVWLAVNRKFKKAGLNPSIECIDVPDNAYADGAIALKSIELMKDFQQKDKLFFLTVGFRKPHLPFVAPKKYWNLYQRKDIKLASFQEQAKDSPKFAYHSFGELKNYSDIKGNLDQQGRVIDAKQRELIHGYYACVSYVDAQIGLLMEHLKSSGLDKNTVVVLIGDHGWHLGDHGLWNKHSNFEQATRTPMMIFAPQIEGSLVNSSPVELVDVFPTICDLTNQKIPDHLQGESLLPILNGSAEKVKDFAISQYPRGGKMGYALRNNQYRYIEWHEKDFNTKEYKEENIVAVELYDYATDPLETRNLARDKAYTQVVKSLKMELKKVLKK